MQLLYVRRKDDVFLKSFLQYLDKSKFEISILDLKNGEFRKYNEDTIEQLNKNSHFRIINYVQRFITGIKFILKYRKSSFDIVHFLNIKRENFWLLPFFRKRSNKIIINVYGKSTFRSAIKRNLFRFFYKYTAKIVFTNYSVIEEFLSFNKNIDKNKIAHIFLPINQLREIHFIEENASKKEYYDLFDLKEDLIHISCSSTIAAYDQHIKIIESLKRIKNKNKVELMFLLSYGGTALEKEKIIKTIHSELSDFKVKIIDKFLTDAEIAAYRMVTDIYINMRTSDQLAGAMIESLYSGALLLAGSWLNYEQLVNLGIYYKKVDNFNNLTACIDESIENLDEFKLKYSKSNSEKIKKEFRVDEVIRKWENFYTQLA